MVYRGAIEGHCQSNVSNLAPSSASPVVCAYFGRKTHPGGPTVNDCCCAPSPKLNLRITNIEQGIPNLEVLFLFSLAVLMLVTKIPPSFDIRHSLFDILRFKLHLP